MSDEGAASGPAVGHGLKTDELRRLLATATYLPSPLVTAMAIVALVSSLDVNLPESGGIHWHVSVSAITLISIALIWLPTALRPMSLTGGSVKAAAVEASAARILQAPEI